MLYAHKLFKSFESEVLLPPMLNDMYDFIGEPVKEVGKMFTLSIHNLDVDCLDYIENIIYKRSKLNDGKVWTIVEAIKETVDYSWLAIIKTTWYNKILTVDMCDALYDKFHNY